MAAAKALSELSHLGCWLGKQANATPAILSDLLVDEESTKHLMLQNRTATDVLLRAHGHGCQDFKGLCCFNLSSHSESIHMNLWITQRINPEAKAEGLNKRTEGRKEPRWDH